MDNRLDVQAYVDHVLLGAVRQGGFDARGSLSPAAWRREARAELRRLLGLPVIAAAAAGADGIGGVELDDAEPMGAYTRAYGLLATDAGVRIPFWFLRPPGPGPFPLALMPHGHEAFGMNTYVGIARDEAHRARIEREDRAVGVAAVKRGFAAVVPTTRGFRPAAVPDVGDRHGGSDCRSQLIHCLLAGRTALGERVWDMTCFLDWACARQDVDGERVLMMGNSGGGMVTLFTAACDRRVSAAVASCSFCTTVGASGQVHHCDCNCIPGLLRFGNVWDVAGLIAPRRLLAVNGAQDPLFPIAEVARAATQTARVFAESGAPDAFRHAFGDGGHRFYADIMWPFVEAWLHDVREEPR